MKERIEKNDVLPEEEVRAKLLALGKGAEEIKLEKLNLIQELARAIQKQGHAESEDDALAKAFDAFQDLENHISLHEPSAEV